MACRAQLRSGRRPTSPERVILSPGDPLALRPPQTIPLRMKTVVAVKQVAVLDDELELLGDGFDVDPSFLDLEPSEWDRFSLGAGLQLRDTGGGEVNAIRSRCAGGGSCAGGGGRARGAGSGVVRRTVLGRQERRDAHPIGWIPRDELGRELCGP